MFDGHGTFLPESQIGGLFFELPDDATGKSNQRFVRAGELGELLTDQEVPLMVLAACRSGDIGKAAVFRAVAPQLIQAGVRSVLSMGFAVHVEAARLLFERFYRELAAGLTIGQALAQGRRALRRTPARWIESGPIGRSIPLQDWFLPHLYQRGVDDALYLHRSKQQKTRPFDVFLSHQHNDAVRVAALANTLSNEHGLEVWLDTLEIDSGELERQCEAGVRASRFTVVAGSRTQMNSAWVAKEIAWNLESSPDRNHILPIKFEPVTFNENLEKFLWLDFSDPNKDVENAAMLAAKIRARDAEDAIRARGFRPPPEHGQPGAFPRPPQFGFQGRARELYELERAFRCSRGIVLHAMGGMGKTALASEAAQWWTRSGLFRDGACFVSFERAVDARRVIAILGEYCEGPKFHQRPDSDQRRRAIEFMREKEVLMVWDNYESTLPAFGSDESALATPYTDEIRRELADLFRDLTSGQGKGAVLVTCRPGDTNLPGARKFELHGLARADSLWLLHRILERDGASLSDPRLTREKLEPLLRDLADHPLSLELVGPHLRTMTPERIRADFGKLVETMRQDSDQGRNTSLLASLGFSRRHLSPAARAALPWLGLFSGGVFEINLLNISQIEPAAWEEIRAELQGIALLRTENDIQIGDRPFLRFHPTLASASAESALAERFETRERFLKVYFAFMQLLDKMLRGTQSRAALAILDREEMNWRTAVRWAIADDKQKIAAELGDTFCVYLQRSGRLRERDIWVRMLHDAVTQGAFTEEESAYKMENAWTVFNQGDPRGAVDKLQGLTQKLRQTTEFDPAFQLATTTVMLGRVLYHSGNSTQAIPLLREAVRMWEQLVERAGGQPWDLLLQTGELIKASLPLGNLSAAMGELSNGLAQVSFHEAVALVFAGIRFKRHYKVSFMLFSIGFHFMTNFLVGQAFFQSIPRR